MKNKRLEIRLTEKQKDDVLALAKVRGMSVTDLFLTEILKEKDKVKYRNKMNCARAENFDYSKIATNINQVAKYVNTEQKIDENTLREFNLMLRELIILKNKANDFVYKYLMDIEE